MDHRVSRYLEAPVLQFITSFPNNGHSVNRATNAPPDLGKITKPFVQIAVHPANLSDLRQ